jgi:polyphenol oxidase
VSELFLTCRLLPVPHGFSVRQGGVSTGPWRSLNLGAQVGDDPLAVAENLARLSRAAGFGGAPFATVAQVHGERVIEVRAPTLQAACAEEADALWTCASGLPLAVRTADCVPLLIVDPQGRRAAAVHSGWRGTVAHIAARAVQALVAQGSVASDLLCAVGPAIGPCCYEVSLELAERFLAAFGPGTVRVSAHRSHLDLQSAVVQTLTGAGVLPGHVEVLPLCTACDASRFFSHRRDGGRTGRQLAFVAL